MTDDRCPAYGTPCEYVAMVNTQTVEAQAKEIAELREMVENWIFHHERATGSNPKEARAYAKAWVFRNAGGEEPE